MPPGFYDKPSTHKPAIDIPDFLPADFYDDDPEIRPEDLEPQKPVEYEKPKKAVPKVEPLVAPEGSKTVARAEAQIYDKPQFKRKGPSGFASMETMQDEEYVWNKSIDDNCVGHLNMQG